MEEKIVEMLAVTSFSLGLFGVVFCLLQDRDVWVFRSFAAFVLAASLMELNTIVPSLAPAANMFVWEVIAELIWLVCMTCVAPLFWLYVCTLTMVSPRLPERVWLHVALPFATLGVVLATLTLSREDLLGLFRDDWPLPDGVALLLGYSGEVIIILAAVQWGAYVFAIAARLLKYRVRLRDHFASTARRELTWIWVLLACLGVYWATFILQIVTLIAWSVELVSDGFDAALSTVLVAVTLLWGLRQRPGLVPDVAPDTVTKYEKSALTQEMSTRIERKLRAAMTVDHLHHDPNLSLWALAKHIGASPNYISQTLNENIGESFFDFINRYRIEDAKEQLQTTDRTVLEIAYDVGFNSRSSFYTAFTKVAGQTPTAYRGSVSGSIVQDR